MAWLSALSVFALAAALALPPGAVMGATPASPDLDQCRNGTAAHPQDCVGTQWQNGNVGSSQGHLLEGYSEPFRAVMTNLPTNTAITLVIGYDIRNSGKNAYDYLTQYDRLEPHDYFGHPAEAVVPTSGVTGFSNTTSTFDIPAPSSAGSPTAGQPTASFNSLPAAQRVMTLFGGTITGMAYASQGSLTTNQSETQVSVTFTSDNPTAVLAWGGHIAQCSVWGTESNGECNSAGGINGSPYHMRLVSWGPNLPNLGNTDRSLSAAAIPQPGSLELAKALTGGPNGYVGPFTIHYDCGAPYEGDVSVDAGSSKTIAGIPYGSTCTVSEPNLPSAPADYTWGTPTFSPSNTATIKAGQRVTVTTTNALTFVPKPALSLTKIDDLNPAKYDHAGQVVTYTLTATNTGNVTLHNVTVSDDPALAGFSCDPAVPATLAPGAKVTCTGTHAISQADLDTGWFKDTASATSDEAKAPDADDTVYADKDAVLGLTKTDDLNPAKYDHVGQVVTYTITATNLGNVTLHNVSVSDDPALTGFGCNPASPVASLVPGAKVVCTGMHAISQADLDAGWFKDTASAASDEATAPQAPDTVFAAGDAILGLTKTDSLDGAKYDHVGQVVTYTITATNLGNLTLHNVTVSDDPALMGFSCDPAVPASLAPGAKVVCTGTHAITQADLDAGSFKDTASAMSDEVKAPDADDTVFGIQTARLGLTKTDDLNPAKYNAVGQVVTYTITATNTGNVTLQNVNVTDDPELTGFSCDPMTPVASLAPGAKVVCTGTHAITQADLDAGSFKDVASATAGGGVEAPDAEDTVYAAQAATIGVTKTDNLNEAGGGFDHAGQVVTYTITATNTGNVTLHNVTVTDDPVLDGFTCDPTTPVASLAPGAKIVCTGTHTITAADMEALTVTDVATAKSDEASATATDTVPGEEVHGATGTPVASATPPTTSTGSGGASGDGGWLFGLLLCLAIGTLGMVLIEAQRRTIRR